MSPGVAGFDDFAAGAAFEGGAEGREIEAAFGFVGVVAVEAGLFENREDVLVIGDLLLRGVGKIECCEYEERAQHGWHLMRGS